MKIIVTAQKPSDSSVVDIELIGTDAGNPATNVSNDRVVLRIDGLEINVDTLELMDALLVVSGKYNIENVLKDLERY